MRIHPIRIALAVALSLVFAAFLAAPASASAVFPPSVPYSGDLVITGVCPDQTDKLAVQIYYKRSDGIEAGYYTEKVSLTQVDFTYSLHLSSVFVVANSGDYETGDHLLVNLSCDQDGSSLESHDADIPVTGDQGSPTPAPTPDPNSDPKPGKKPATKKSATVVQARGTSFETGVVTSADADSPLALWGVVAGVMLATGGAGVVAASRRRVGAK